ncbi:MAG: tRNA glutamyl-Q(34) synthetase GluQRS [Planctomycetota bacterium]
MASEPQRVTRLAPSPTGALHLGNARTFLVNWAMATQRGWRVALRIEDLDTPRVKPGADRQALDDLRWLGLTWDGSDDPAEATLTQRDDLTPYRDALLALHERGLIYPCALTRSEIAEAAASAPQALAPGVIDRTAHEQRYPGTSRDADASDTTDLLAPSDRCWRVRIPDGPRAVTDGLLGDVSIDVQAEVGDFIVATKAGLPSYQLAVVVDDHRQGVTDVVRGDDLIGSAARQGWLWEMLGLTVAGRREPSWWHLPLVLGEDGRRLAKRHGDTRVAMFREQGVPAERVVGLLAWWSGVTAEPMAMSATEFAERFTLDALPRDPVAMDAKAWQWLGGNPEGTTR